MYRRWARPAALLLTVGTLSAGLSACGSSSSTQTGTPSASVASKAAGAFSKEVQVTVLNDPSTGGSLFMSVCAAGSTVAAPTCGSPVVADGDSIYLTSEAVNGLVKDGTSTGFYYYAQNPAVGEPSFSLWKIGDPQGGAEQIKLSENETVTKFIAGRKIELARGPDTSVKVMTLKVVL